MGWLIENAILGIVLAGSVWLASRLLSIRASLRHLLWMLVLVRLVLPPLVRVDPNFISPSRVITAVATIISSDSRGAALEQEGTRARPVARARETWWVTVWGVVCLLLLGRVGLVARRLTRNLAAASPAPHWLDRLVDRTAERMEVRRNLAVVCPETGRVPYLTGVLHPRLAVPVELIRQAPRGVLEAVLIHELAHLKRRDLWSGWLEAIVGAITWWHPVSWLARNRMREAAELACDEWVMELAPGARRGYASLLVGCAEVAAPHGAVGWVTRQSSRGVHQLRERIDHLWSPLRPSKHRLRLVGPCLFACTLLLPMVDVSALASGSGGSGVRTPTLGTLARGHVVVDRESGDLQLGPDAWLLAFAYHPGKATQSLFLSGRDHSGSLPEQASAGVPQVVQFGRQRLSQISKSLDWASLAGDSATTRSWSLVPRGGHALRSIGEESLAAWLDRHRLWVVDQADPDAPVRVLEAVLERGKWQVVSYQVDGRPADFSEARRKWFGGVLQRLSKDHQFGSRMPR